ncbi:hypothetical protein H4219_004119 [Mycoemilia scoparia]|uniref:Uncharacterized protein n=1 Tax=Mycoemilia scoparia TaxID=417184 RepID=A0A9W7ZZ92_9FUNG|nr:hypothetical protein H4219_004119 [Mycoemilia scoparia]
MHTRQHARESICTALANREKYRVELQNSMPAARFTHHESIMFERAVTSFPYPPSHPSFMQRKHANTTKLATPYTITPQASANEETNRDTLVETEDDIIDHSRFGNSNSLFNTNHKGIRIETSNKDKKEQEVTSSSLVTLCGLSAAECSPVDLQFDIDSYISNRKGLLVEDDNVDPPTMSKPGGGGNGDPSPKSRAYSPAVNQRKVPNDDLPLTPNDRFPYSLSSGPIGSFRSAPPTSKPENKEADSRKKKSLMYKAPENASFPVPLSPDSDTPYICKTKPERRSLKRYSTKRISYSQMSYCNNASTNSRSNESESEDDLNAQAHIPKLSRLDSVSNRFLSTKPNHYEGGGDKSTNTYANISHSRKSSISSISSFEGEVIIRQNIPPPPPFLSTPPKTSIPTPTSPKLSSVQPKSAAASLSITTAKSEKDIKPHSLANQEALQRRAPTRKMINTRCKINIPNDEENEKFMLWLSFQNDVERWYNQALDRMCEQLNTVIYDFFFDLHDWKSFIDVFPKQLAIEWFEFEAKILASMPAPPLSSSFFNPTFSACSLLSTTTTTGGGGSVISPLNAISPGMNMSSVTASISAYSPEMDPNDPRRAHLDELHMWLKSRLKITKEKFFETCVRTILDAQKSAYSAARKDKLHAAKSEQKTKKFEEYLRILGGFYGNSMKGVRHCPVVRRGKAVGGAVCGSPTVVIGNTPGPFTPTLLTPATAPLSNSSITATVNTNTVTPNVLTTVTASLVPVAASKSTPHIK